MANTTQDFLDRTVTDGRLAAVPGTQGSQTGRLYSSIFDDLDKAHEILLSQYYHDYEFVMKVPDLPDSNFLHVHPSVRDAFELRRDEVTKEDLAAMGSGLLDRINIDYHLLHPEDAQMMNDHVKETHAAFYESREAIRKKGLNFVPLENPMEKNPELDQLDLDLCDIDLDDNPMNQKDLPTLSLLKRPLYTELGQLSKEARTNARIARIVNQSSQHPGLEVATQNADAPGDAPGAGSGIPALPAPKGPPQTDDEWKDQVAVSFKRAKALDTHFRTFILTLALEKLGVSGSSKDSERGDRICVLTRELLRLLAVPGSSDHVLGSTLSSALANLMWVDVCAAVTAEKPEETGFKSITSRLIGATTRLAVELRTPSVMAAADAYGAEWQTWWEKYAALTEGTIPSQRRALLKGNLPDESASTFKLSLVAEGAVTLRHPTKRDLTPMVVKPLLPSCSHDPNVAGTGHYGNDCQDLTHLVYHNTKPNHGRDKKDATQSVPTLSSRESNGTVVYRPLTSALETCPSAVNPNEAPEAGGTSLYISHEEEFVAGKPLMCAQGSYVLQVYNDRVEYSRVGKRVIHEHKLLAPGRKEELRKNIVVVWEDEDDTEEPPQKRQRLEA